MRKSFAKALFYYSAIASFIIAASAVLSSRALAPVIFAILFLPVAAYFVIEFFGQIRSVVNPKTGAGTDMGPSPRKSELFIILAVFLILMGVGIRNILTSRSTNTNTETLTSNSNPLIFNSAPSTPSPSPVLKVKIVLTDGSQFVNILQKADANSVKVGEAWNGNIFEVVGKESGWYQIKLEDGSIGFIPASYVKEEAQ